MCSTDEPGKPYTENQGPPGLSPQSQGFGCWINSIIEYSFRVLCFSWAEVIALKISYILKFVFCWTVSELTGMANSTGPFNFGHTMPVIYC